MKAVAAKKWLFGLSAALSVSLSLLPAVSAYAADQHAYLKSYGADISAGGWFSDSAGNCGGSNYQTGSSGSPLTGGIITYANSNGSGSGTSSNGGSSSQYGAFATGNVDGASGSPQSGFYSDGASPGSYVGGLTFADINNLPWGGNFDGNGVQPSECIPDYYDTYAPTNDPNTITPDAGHQQDFLGLSPDGSTCPSSGVYYIDATKLPGGYYNVNQDQPQDICPGKNIAVIVKGDVVVSNDIHIPAVYLDNAVYDDTNVPKFAVVALGNIYFASNVSHVDGWYIAQPDPSDSKPLTDNTGVIWDCFPRDTTGDSVDGIYLSQNCQHPLVIQGALTAKHINFLRSGGEVSNASKAEDQSGYPASLINDCDQQSPSNCNLGEIINYPPAMVLGGGFFDQNTTTSPTNIESLISLPPVF